MSSILKGFLSSESIGYIALKMFLGILCSSNLSQTKPICLNHNIFKTFFYKYIKQF